MEVDFDGLEETTDYVSVPAGIYLCQIADVRIGSTRGGDERWGLRLVVAEGEHAGRQAAWDSLVFSPRGRPRVRRVLHAFGLPSTGKVKLEPSDLEGRRAFVEVRPTEYVAGSGETIRRNEVPYDGYRALDGAEPVIPAEEPGAPGRGDGKRRRHREDEIPF